MDQRRAAVFGASGGIGAALADALEADGCEVWRGSRGGGGLRGFAFDLTDEDSIAAAVARIGGELDLVLVASGVLHDAARGVAPEKSWRQIDPAAMARAFAVNAIGPALVAKHVLPLLPKGRRGVFAALSARVGSIGDNRLGGWHSYRASKAALNMLVRNLAIECARSRPQAVVVALHPGTVATGLSAPFQRGVPAERLFTPAVAAGALLGVVARLTPADSGGLFAWDGQAIPW
ncbi:MAG: SDR family NAD(P)-dependent oxidoreductase [Sphingomonadales bacterium]|nr:SDR family NAD(P)-dependent oxidoreductase [Sphingomonadales bacterium]